MRTLNRKAVFVSLLAVAVMVLSAAVVAVGAEEAEGAKCRHTHTTWEPLYTDYDHCEKHAKRCTDCGKVILIENHDPINGNENLERTCDGLFEYDTCKKCGYQTKKYHVFDHLGSAEIDGKTHQNVQICSCGEPMTAFMEDGGHTYSWHLYSSQYDAYYCDYCGYKKGDPLQPHSLWLLSDASGHWTQCSVCGHAFSGKSSHNWDKGVTHVCYGPANGIDYYDTYELLRCTECGYEKLGAKLESHMEPGDGVLENISVPNDWWPQPCSHSKTYFRQNHTDPNCHDEVCYNCGEVLHERVLHNWKLKTAEDLYRELGGTGEYGSNGLVLDQVHNAYWSGHVYECTVCHAEKTAAHTFKGRYANDAADPDHCGVYCTTCDYELTLRMKITNTDPTPHTFYSAQYIIDLDLDEECPFECSYVQTDTHHHRGTCTDCGGYIDEACDSDGWEESPGTPGQHWSFCSKCGGNRHLVDCTAEYHDSNHSLGTHEVWCSVCKDCYIPAQDCEFELDPRFTDQFNHYYTCGLCGHEFVDPHILKTVMTNYNPSTENTKGSYTLTTYCEHCGMVLVTNTVSLDSYGNGVPLCEVRVGYTITDNGERAPITTWMPDLILSGDLAKYVAEHSKEILGENYDVLSGGSAYITVGGENVEVGLTSSNTRIVIEPIINMTVTGNTYEQVLMGNVNAYVFRDMTATFTVTVEAYGVVTVGGTEYRFTTAVSERPLSDFLDLDGVPITVLLPMLSNMQCGPTMYVEQTVGNDQYVYAGYYASNLELLACVEFTAVHGFSGTFRFFPAELDIEHIEPVAPTHWATGNIGFWYCRALDTCYSDVLCENEITFESTRLAKIPFEVTYDPNGGTGSIDPDTFDTVPADLVLPECTFTYEGMEFFAWNDGYCNYRPGEHYTVYGDTEFRALWYVSGQSQPSIWTIHFMKNAEDATGTMETQTFVDGDPVTLRANEFEYEGHYFHGWNWIWPEHFEWYFTDESTSLPEYLSNAYYAAYREEFEGQHIYLYAVWNPAFTVTYDANGGTGSMDRQLLDTVYMSNGDYYYATTAYASPNTFERDKYVFSCWYTNADGTGTRYADGGSLYGLRADVTLYAKWDKVVFDVTFDKNAEDATGTTESQTFDKGVKARLNDCGFSREGYVFAGWNSAADGTGSNYTAGNTMQFVKDTVLYAKWQRVWTVTFNKNAEDAEGSMDPFLAKDNTYSTLPVNAFTRENFVFDGWYANAEGTGTKYYDKGSVKLTAPLDLYAKWKQVYFVVTFDANGGEGTMDQQIIDYLDGHSSVCPNCTKARNLVEVSTNLYVAYCDCDTLMKIHIAEGSTADLTNRSYASLEPYGLPASAFDPYSAAFAALAAELSITGQVDVLTLTQGTDAYDAYQAFFGKAKALMDASLSEVTKDNRYTSATGAVIGINQKYMLTESQSAYSYDDYIWLLSLLFGCPDSDSFLTYVQGMSAMYAENSLGATTSARLKYDGTVFTENGSFVLPYAFRSNQLDQAVLSCLIVDAEGNVSAWISDSDLAFLTADYSGTLSKKWEIQIDAFGRCTLFEKPTMYANGFTRDRYTFSNWNTAADGSGTKYYAGSSASLTGNVTLYATWTPNFAVVSFDANGGTGTMEDQLIDKMVETEFDECTFTREGYVFAGWNKTSTATSGSLKATLYSTSPVTYYAIWKRLVTISYDANGGFGLMADQVVEENSYNNLNANRFLHQTKAFDGWNTAADGSGTAYADGYRLKVTDDMALYAQWKDKTDVGSIMTLESVESVYNGEGHQSALAHIEFTDAFSQGTNAGWKYLYYSGDRADEANLLAEGELPTDAGTYTVVAVYEDSMNIGQATATMTIEKAVRTVVPTAPAITLYGEESIATLRLNSDFDGSADMSQVTVQSQNAGVTSMGVAACNKTGVFFTVPLAFVSEGYTTVTITVPASANYTEASADVVVIAKGGYDVNAVSPDGISISVDKAKAPKGATVTVDYSVRSGWTLERIKVVEDWSGQEIALDEGSFVMPGSTVTVTAVIEKTGYTIAYTPVDGVAYAQSNPAAACYGDIVALSADVDGGNAVKAFRYTYGNPSVTVDVPAAADGTFSFDMPAQDITVTAVLGQLYAVTIADGIANGTVTASVQEAFEGQTVTILPAAGDGYVLGTLTYRVGQESRAVSVGVGDTGATVYTIIMPAAAVEIGASFLSEAAVSGAVSNVNGSSASEKGANQAGIGMVVDVDTADTLQAALDSVEVDIEAGDGSIQVSNADKKAALEALSQAGLITIGGNGQVTVLNGGSIRIVRMVYVDVSVSGFDQSGNILTFHITPMSQTVATTSDGLIGSGNSVPLSAAQPLDITDLTHVTVGIPADMARAAGGIGSTIYVGHAHDGRSYEYRATIGGNDQDGYTATFDNPNGYSEFTLSIQPATLASYVYQDVTYYYTVFADAIADALSRNVTSVTMHGMPSGNDVATVTRAVSLTFSVAQGREGNVDFDSLYTAWIEADAGITKASTGAQLADRVFAYTRTFAVSFETSGGSAVDPQVVIEGQKAVRPSDPVMENYRFDGWFSDEARKNAFDFDTAIVGDTIVYAKWVIMAYTITYNLDGGINAQSNPATFTYESAAIVFADPSKDMYTFGGWYGNAQFTGDRITGVPAHSDANVEVFAKWVPVEYTVTYHLNGGDVAEANPATYTYESAAIVFNDPVREYNDFGGWYDNDSFAGDTVTGIPAHSHGDKHFYAKWTPAVYDIVYVLNGGTNSQNNPASYAYGSAAIQFADPSRDYYDFGGWYSDSQFTGEAVTGIADGSHAAVTVYARWTAHQYSITYEPNGGSSAQNPASYTCESETIQLTAPVRDYYDFGGWFADAQFAGDAIAAIPAGSHGDLQFFAKWTAHQYSVNYHLDGGTNAQNNPATFTVESSEIVFSDPSKDGSLFLGWYRNAQFDGEQIVRIPAGSHADFDLYARWSVSVYGITYNLNGGTNALNNPETFTYESADILFADPVRDYYDFGGWFADAQFSGEPILGVPTHTGSDVEVFAKWIPVEYTVTYVVNNGTNAQNNAASYTVETAAIQFADPVRDYYDFGGWYADAQFSGDGIAGIPAGSHGDVTVYAKWTAHPYSVTYNLNGGTMLSANPETYTCESAVALFAPEKVGHTFAGWYADAQFTGDAIAAIPAGSHGDLQFFAKWTVNSYRITFDAAGGDAVGATDVQYGSDLALPAAVRAGYSFAGWLENGIAFRTATMPARDVNLTASWCIIVMEDTAVAITVETESAIIDKTDAAITDALADASKTEIKVTGDGWTMEIPKSVISQADGAVSVSARPVTETERQELPAEVQTKVAGKQVFSLSMEDSSGKVDFTGKKITVTLPYVLKDGENASDLKVFYLDDGNVLHGPIDAAYDAEKQCVVFVTDHFSKWFVDYVPENTSGDSPGGGFPILIVVVIAIAAAAVAAGVVILRRRA